MIFDDGGLVLTAEDNPRRSGPCRSAQRKCLLGDRAKLFFL